jgi:hypothetical protein
MRIHIYPYMYTASHNKPFIHLLQITCNGLLIMFFSAKGHLLQFMYVTLGKKVKLSMYLSN